MQSFLMCSNFKWFEKYYMTIIKYKYPTRIEWKAIDYKDVKKWWMLLRLYSNQEQEEIFVWYKWYKIIK